MKRFYTLIAIIVFTTNINAQNYVTIPDHNFSTWLQNNVPAAMSGNQLDTTSVAVTSRKNINIEGLGISNLFGIQFFDSLVTLDCGNGQFVNSPNTISTIPSVPNTLDTLICGGNLITQLPSLPSTLRVLKCYSNPLHNLPNPLPSSLTYLDCHSDILSNLPSLPSTLEYLNCSFNLLNSLPPQPNNLYYLDCNINSIDSLPTLSNALTTLYCMHNQLVSMPSFPNTLINLDCSYNTIDSLPSLSTSLSFLNCSSNQLTAMPAFPNSLIYINCSVNNIVNLPTLPSNINVLYCNNNQLTALPTLPLSLNYLDCSYNQILCFYAFHNITGVFNISNNPNNCLPNYIPIMDSGTLNYPLCLPGNSNGCPNAEGIVGFTYNDNNTNCIKDSGDIGIKNIPLHIYDLTGNLLSSTYTALNGIYQFQQTANTYSVAVDTVRLPIINSCQYPGIDSTVTVLSLDTNVNFAFNCKPGFDIGVQSIGACGIVFPGQAHTLHVNAGDMSRWYNLNCAAGISGMVTFTVNGPVTYVAPAAGALTPIVNGNTYSYNIADFGLVNNNSDFNIILLTDTTAISGNVICVKVNVTPTNGDNDLTNNTYNFCYDVINSHDPNFKEVYPVMVMPGFNDWLTFTVHFQNTGNAPAINIRVADTLDNMLDLSTFQVIGYSHNNIVDLTGSILQVRFPNIQLPDSTTNRDGSQGYIQYRVKPKTAWTGSYQITNTAYIYFDYNTPVITNTTYNSIMKITSVTEDIKINASVYPNPNNGNFTIELDNNEKQQLLMYDISGNEVLNQIIENGKININANYLSSGVYTINIKGNNSVINKKIVIVK